MVFTELANKVAKNLNEKQKIEKAVAFDPAIIMVIIQVIQLIVENLKNCNLFNPIPNNPNLPALEVCKDPGLMQRFMLKRIIYKSGVQSRVDARKVYDAVLDTGKNLKNDDLKNALEELDFNMM
jgi:hypothetical protein